jgi:hypothetical protein
MLHSQCSWDSELRGIFQGKDLNNAEKNAIGPLLSQMEEYDFGRPSCIGLAYIAAKCCAEHMGLSGFFRMQVDTEGRQGTS